MTLFISILSFLEVISNDEEVRGVDGEVLNDSIADPEDLEDNQESDEDELSEESSEESSKESSDESGEEGSGSSEEDTEESPVNDSAVDPQQ